MYKISFVLLIIMISCCFRITFAQKIDYGYENWPGKNGAIKSNIKLAKEIIVMYNLSLAKGSSETSFFYKIPLDENDQVKKGRLQVEVYSSIEEAQLNLVEYLDCLTTPVKPPRLTDEDFKIGDIAFGNVINGILRMAFTRNNVLIIVHAPLYKAKDIAKKVDECVQKAPVWEKDVSKPHFILP